MHSKDFMMQERYEVFTVCRNLISIILNATKSFFIFSSFLVHVGMVQAQRQVEEIEVSHSQLFNNEELSPNTRSSQRPLPPRLPRPYARIISLSRAEFTAIKIAKGVPGILFIYPSDPLQTSYYYAKSTI